MAYGNSVKGHVVKRWKSLEDEAVVTGVASIEAFHNSPMGLYKGWQQLLHARECEDLSKYDGILYGRPQDDSEDMPSTSF
ncbi:hypothetical protein E4U57_004780 [Claviceps arundinis]|uniref:Uncharacterized protein n=1 Tax=Claviceps arundinis TaxID=1623583 RepID=A0ABQ7P4E2_9HYPO|nr:hypothetical protein E4U57_004780 [Claviceps arundinis]